MLQHLPPLKSKLIGGPGTLFNGVTSNGHQGTNSDNCDSMSINGSIVSNGSVTSVSGNGTNGHSLTNGVHHNGHNVHTNGMATLPLVRPTTGDNVSRNSTTLESPKHDSNSQQNGNGSGNRETLINRKAIIKSQRYFFIRWNELEEVVNIVTKSVKLNNLCS